MEKIKDAARKSGLFIVVDSDLAFNQPTERRSTSTASRPTSSASRCRQIGDTLALLVGENYVNRFNLGGRSYEVIPQVPRADRLNAGDADAVLRQLGGRRSRCRCRTW